MTGRSRVRRLGGAASTSLACFMLATVVLVMAAPAAHGINKKIDRFFPLNGAAGAQGGQFNTPRDIAINQSSPSDAKDGWVYVADTSNNRIQAFNAAGVFQWAIGRNVSITATTGNDSGSPSFAFEKCVSATDCQGGTSSAAVGGFGGVRGGMFNQPQGIAINQSNGHFLSPRARQSTCPGVRRRWRLRAGVGRRRGIAGRDG